MGLTPYFRKRSVKNGKRIWINCTFNQTWMLPLRIEFECGDVYRRIEYDFSRRAAYYERIDDEVKPIRTTEMIEVSVFYN